MRRNLFYSWQSDLPNNSNRGFIESCIKKSIKKLEKIAPFTLELNLDRDTRNISGTPDIANTIFEKISHSKIFVADISIINSSSKDRKCPNPNVLVELGFAVRVLGWERIFCIYNLDYGNFDDLPFDLRQRRPISYSINKFGKEKCRNEISSILTDSIIALHKKGGLFDAIDDYIKEQVDTEILTIGSHLGKILFGYTGNSGPALIQLLTNLTEDEIKSKILSQEFIGFQIFKNLDIHEQKFRKFADDAISSFHHDRELAAIMIGFLNWIRRYESINSTRNSEQLFKEIGEEVNQDFKVLPASSLQNNAGLLNRHILLRKLAESKGIVIDFGDFSRNSQIKKLLFSYCINSNQADVLVSLVRQFADAVNDWLNYTNGEFILDTYQHFEIRDIRI